MLKITMTIEFPAFGSLSSEKKEYSVSSDHWDADAGDVAEMMRSLMLAAGYSPDSVDAQFAHDGCCDCGPLE